MSKIINIVNEKDHNEIISSFKVRSNTKRSTIIDKMENELKIKFDEPKMKMWIQGTVEFGSGKNDLHWVLINKGKIPYSTINYIEQEI